MHFVLLDRDMCTAGFWQDSLCRLLVQFTFRLVLLGSLSLRPLFSGVHTHGDSWKAPFFMLWEAQGRSQFVD